MVEKVSYDEFSMFHENASEYGIAYTAPPVVSREFISVDGTRKLSALKWGTGSPRLVFLHGGAQNAHTWDTVALALDVPLLCIDLPGHGRSAVSAGAVSLADMAAYWKRSVRACDARVSLVGAVSRAQAHDVVSALLRAAGRC